MNESVLKTWFRRVWDEGDADAIDELFAADGASLAYLPS